MKNQQYYIKINALKVPEKKAVSYTYWPGDDESTENLSYYFFANGRAPPFLRF